MNSSFLSTVEWPSGWRAAPLWSLFDRVKDTGHPHEEMLSVYRGQGVRRRGADNNSAQALDRSVYQLVHPGWLVVNRMQAWRGAVGISPYRGIVSGHYICYRPKHDEEPRFLDWLMQSSVYATEYATLSRGVRPNQAEIDNDFLRSIPIYLPPLEEQRRIADFLDTETAHVDRLVALRTRQATVLEERFSAFVSELLMPGILSAPTYSGSHPWLPRLPEDRPLVRLGFVCRLQNGVTVDSMRQASSEDVTLPYLRVANVQSGHVDLGVVSEITVPRAVAKRSMLRRGDVLMTEGGDLDKLGRGAVWRAEIPTCLHQNHVFALRPDISRLHGDYLALMTQTVHGRCYFESTGNRTTNLASTNSSKILSFPLPLPRVELQRSLVRAADREFSGLSRARDLLERQLKLLAERRQAVATAAVTGQFDVSTASGRGITEGVSV